jgi:capsular exopolysaccharide synthesis family protein
LRGQQDLQLAADAVNNYANQLRQQYKSMVPGTNGNSPFVVSTSSVDLAKRDLTIQQNLLTEKAKEIATLGAIHQQVDQIEELDHRSDDKIKSYSDDIDRLNVAIALNGQIVSEGKAVEPLTPTIDKRKQMALAGFVVGGGLPVGLILLMGLIDARYRYSEEASDSGVSGLTLLGILPNLPDRLSDPGQASIAAHCVHQIRTMLQINNNEDRRAFSVTSASSGDGKTSLTLALGLSFAASGSRTLLIDSDLVGAGLTARLGMNGPEGILEAMTNGNLLEYTKTTDVSDLAILPVGLAQLHHAGIFSPAAVRRLINEAKKHFEVILIDTGPILGSIEATPVTSASDGVILTVARGQQRPLVDKALTHLRSIGARVAGVVFNRAQAKDFEQSISGISMRSASRSANGNAHSRANQAKDAGQYGPVARAVATSFRGNENGNGNGNGSES